MTPHPISKTPLASDPDKAQAQLEDLAATMTAKDQAAGQHLRAVAVELVRCGLHVALVDYHGGWSELEATLPQAPHLGPVTLDRDVGGTICQLAWDGWADITTPARAAQAAATAAALLGALASSPPPAAPSVLTGTRDLAPRAPRASNPGPGQAGKTP